LLLTDDAIMLLAQAHLDRLIDRVRHALPKMTEMVHVCRRFRFNGIALPSHIRPDNCWWFTQGEGDAHVVVQYKPSRGPPRGIRRMCYTFVQVALGRVFQIDWQEITAAVVLRIFQWFNYQTSLYESGLDAVVAECSSRTRVPPADQGSALTLHILDLPKLAQSHVEHMMEESRAWQLEYDSQGMAVLPPWRVPQECIHLMTEHEVQMLLRRPKLSHIMRIVHNLIVSRQWEEILAGLVRHPPSGQEEKSPEVEIDGFHDDTSVLSDVTPDASHMSDSAPVLVRD
jgi:hypothetical protein